MILLLAQVVHANNLELSSLNVSATNTAEGTITFNYDLTQDNSWKNTTNFDAVWIFMKYSIDGGRTWKHASMSGRGTNPVGYVVPSSMQVVVPEDQKGFFLQRNEFGTGRLDFKNLTFVWNYNQDGLTAAVAQSPNTLHKIFGIEMVYIPQGPFYAGDGNSSSEYRFKQGSADDDPWYIQNESAFTTSNATSDTYYYQSSNAAGENASGDAFLVPSSFPKGYAAFYMMKYELTEGQWVSFFNTLTNAQKINRDITSSTNGGKNTDDVVFRNTISWDSTNPSSNATTSRPARPMTYISWPDVAAFSAWAGLRPITELEYEKAARGKDIMPIVDEFAWGSTTAVSPNAADIYPNSNEDGSEIINGPANINRNALLWQSGDGRVGGPAANQAGPLRVGIFAANASNRISSGASYYGVMELSGNLAEPVVSLGRVKGRQFLATHGSGELTTTTGYEGYATNTDWPGIDNVDAARGITGTIGIGYRGGDFASSNVRFLQLSSRSFSAKDPDSLGYYQRYDASFGIFGGGRLGRTAP